MSPIVRALRIGLPIALVAFVAVIIYTYQSKRKPPEAMKRPDVKNVQPGDRLTTIASRFEDIQTIAGRMALKINAERVVSFESGWYSLEKVSLTLYRTNGLKYEISAPQAQVHAQTREAELKGGVRIASSDGVSLSTSSMHFKENRVVNERIPVSFTIDQWSGQAGGLDLSVAEESLKLTGGLTATMAPKVSTEPRVDLKAAEATFRRPTADVTFSGGVNVIRGRDQFNAASVVARFNQDQKKLTGLEGINGVTAQLGENSAASGAGVPGGQPMTVKSDRFFTELGPEGEVVAIHVVGEQGDAVAQMSGAPPRTISAREFRIHLAGGVLSEIRATDRVTLVENVVPQRVVHANVATLYFDTAARKPTSALLEQAITYADGKVNAKSERATYELATRRLVLSAIPSMSPSLSTETETLRANSIEVSGIDQSLKATGNVYAELRQKGSPVASDSALFPEKTPIYVNSETAVLRRNDRSAIFNGNVRAWQATNTLFTAELQITGGGENLFARGGMRAALTSQRAPNQKPTPLLASAAQMTANKTQRRVDLEGDVKVDDAGRVLTSQKAVLFVDQRQKLERVEATGNVQLTERETNRKGSGDKAVYKVTQRTVTLQGAPAVITDPRGTVKGSQVLIDLEKNKVNVISGTSATEATYNPQ